MKINWSLAAATHCRPGIIIVEPRVCLLVIFNKIFSSCWKIFLSDIKCSCSNNFLWESIGHYSIDINLHVQLNNSINWCTEAFSPHILSKRNISAESIKLYFVFFYVWHVLMTHGWSVTNLQSLTKTRVGLDFVTILNRILELNF